MERTRNRVVKLDGPVSFRHRLRRLDKVGCLPVTGVFGVMTVEICRCGRRFRNHSSNAIWFGRASPMYREPFTHDGLVGVDGVFATNTGTEESAQQKCKRVVLLVEVWRATEAGMKAAAERFVVPKIIQRESKFISFFMLRYTRCVRDLATSPVCSGMHLHSAFELRNGPFAVHQTRTSSWRAAKVSFLGPGVLPVVKVVNRRVRSVKIGLNTPLLDTACTVNEC
jgi:hypothetical protein